MLWWFSPYIDMNQLWVVLEGLGRKADRIHDSLGYRLQGCRKRQGSRREGRKPLCAQDTVNSALPGAKSRAGVMGEREEERQRNASGRMC